MPVDNIIDFPSLVICSINFKFTTSEDAILKYFKLNFLNKLNLKYQTQKKISIFLFLKI